ncbi:MAG TPA: helix-turn-helix transcriptional regulator [Polyangiaceae bacterium]
MSLALDGPAPSALTSAERAVAQGIVRGLSNAEIARARGTSVRTVANQVASLMRRLSAQSRGQVAARLADADLGPLDGHASLR